MNRKAILLIGLLTDYRGYLAAGQWLAPEMSSYRFCHADFADDADFFLLIIFSPTDFTDLHRFSLVLSLSSIISIFRDFDLSVWDGFTQIFSGSLLFSVFSLFRRF